MKCSKNGLLAATTFALTACDGDDPGDAFLPGDYVVGVIVTGSDMITAADVDEDIYGFGYGEITVDADGTITGSAEFTNVEGPGPGSVSRSLPDGEGEPTEITGTVSGTDYEITFDFGSIKYTSTGTITSEGILTGDFVGPDEFPLTGATGGAVKQGEVAVACGDFVWGDEDPLGDGYAVYLLNGETILGVLGSPDFFGVLTADANFVDVCDIEGCMDSEGKIVAEIDYSGVPSSVTFITNMEGGADETPGGTSWGFSGSGDDAGNDYHIEFGGSTNDCFGFIDP